MGGFCCQKLNITDWCWNVIFNIPATNAAKFFTYLYITYQALSGISYWKVMSLSGY
jgi:hypothetical protein